MEQFDEFIFGEEQKTIKNVGSEATTVKHNEIPVDRLPKTQAEKSDVKPNVKFHEAAESSSKKNKKAKDLHLHVPAEIYCQLKAYQLKYDVPISRFVLDCITNELEKYSSELKVLLKYL